MKTIALLCFALSLCADDTTTPGITCSITGGSPPPGLSMVATDSGCQFSQQALTAPGTYTWVLTVGSPGSTPVSKSLTVKVAPAPPVKKLAVKEATLPPGIVGQPYSHTVKVEVK